MTLPKEPLPRNDTGKSAGISNAHALPENRQLFLDLWPLNSGDTNETRHLKSVADIEREAESALFDWLENRDAPYAQALWLIFAYKSELLSRALSHRP